MLRNHRCAIRSFTISLTPLAAIAAQMLLATTTHASTPQIEQRVDQLLSQLTPEEKIDMLGGVHDFYKAVPGPYEIAVVQSSRDIAQTTMMK